MSANTNPMSEHTLARHGPEEVPTPTPKASSSPSATPFITTTQPTESSANLVRAKYNTLRAERHERGKKEIRNLPEYKVKQIMAQVHKDIDQLYTAENAELGELNLTVAKEVRKQVSLLFAFQAGNDLGSG